jgi:hypothetical protein
MGEIPLMEGYNPVYPDVDTKYSESYKEELFQQIKIGEDTTLIIEKIGYPLEVYTDDKGGYQWNYSTDGKCQWADFAWLLKAIIISKDGKVIKKLDIIVYD